MVLTARAQQVLKELPTAASADEVLAAYPDGAEISGYATDSIAALVAGGVVTGDGATGLRPKDDLTRAQAAVMIYRMLFSGK